MPAAPTSPVMQQGKIEAIQALRLIAALAVVLFHINWIVPDRENSSNVFLLFEKGMIGVDIFFVISGFVMYLTATRQSEFRARSFIADRFWRIFPIYWFVLLLELGEEAFSGLLGLGRSDIASLEYEDALTSVFLLPYYKEFFVVTVAWTLAIEIVFYIIFAISFYFWRLRGVCVSVATWFLLGVVWRSQTDVGPGDDWLLANPRVLEFMFGVLIGYFYIQGRLPFGHIALAAGTVSLVAIFFFLPIEVYHSLPVWLIAGVPSTVLIYGLVSVEIPVPRLLVLGGEASYVLYLIHELGLGVSTMVFRKMTGVNPFTIEWLGILIVIGIVALSILITITVERRILRLRKSSRAKPAQS